MQTKFRLIRTGGAGFALTITLCFLAVFLLIFASIFLWTSANAKLTLRNNQFRMSQAAAEAAVERVLGQIDRDFVALSISNSSAYTTLPAAIDQSSWPVHYTFSDTNGNNNQISVNIGAMPTTTVPLNSQFAGLYGLAQQVDVIAVATPVNQPQMVPATVHESLQFASIPLYQYAIFYNVNMEVSPGAAMGINGSVFCNQSIWEGSSQASFASTVAAVGTNSISIPDPFALNYNGSISATFSMAGQPVNGVNALVMPIGTNNNPASILALLNLPPPDYAMGTANAYSTNGMVYPANAADLVISNFPSGTNFGAKTPVGTNMVIYFQDPTVISALQPIPYDAYIMTNYGAVTITTNGTGRNTSYTTNIISSPCFYNTNYVSNNLLTNIVFAGYSFVTNAAFYDWREGGVTGSAKQVQAVQIDMVLLNTWLTNSAASNSGYIFDGTKTAHSGHHIDSAYVYNSVPLTTKTLPAVRVANGKQLPSPSGSRAGFTVATPFPMYVLGNFNSQDSTGSSFGTNNTLHTYPAALMADSITILSTNWSDLYTNKLPTGTTHGPSSTTVNAATLEGIVQTNPNISGDYSGGVENFLRLLEDWGNGIPSSKQTLTYNGSIVVLFYSQYATNHWQNTGNYYGAPTRNWAFDTNFRNSNLLPPLTPSIKAMVRGNWTTQ